jgi:hypothetical protein
MASDGSGRARVAPQGDRTGWIAGNVVMEQRT